MDDGDGHKALWTYLIPLRCSLKMAKKVNFIFICFATIKDLKQLLNKRRVNASQGPRYHDKQM
jgi:hypothetical protein